jgi:hypothetical protein
MTGRLRTGRRHAALGIVGLMWALPVLAHHSIAMFDWNKPTTLAGTVRQFQWTNPHCFVQVQVGGGQGTTEWSVEMGSPSALYRAGWRPGTLKRGDKVTVIVAPTRDGTAGGLMMSAVTADGRRFGSPAQAGGPSRGAP